MGRGWTIVPVIAWALAVAASLGSLGSLGGCEGFDFGNKPVAPPALPPAPPAARLPLNVQPASRAAEEGFDAVVTQVNFEVICDLLVVDVPLGAISQNAELWTLLHEDSLGVKLTDHLSRNGFRIGLGSPTDLPRASQLIAGIKDGHVRTGRLRFDSDAPAELLIDAQLRLRRAFVFAEDGSASGDEFPAAATVYWVQAWHDVENIDTVKLTLVPEIRFGRPRDKVYSPTIPSAQQHRDVGRIFDEVKLELRQSRGDFFVIAPRTKGGPALALGRTLLTDETVAGQPRELVVVIKPRVVRTPVGP